MTESITNTESLILGIIFGLLIGGFILVIHSIVTDITVPDYKKEAIEKGFLEWRIVNKKTGETELQWIDAKQETIEGKEQ